MKIAHVSDIHIRNFKYHDVYNKVFDELYQKLRELKPDIIINTGDTAHTKLQLSPAYFDMTAKFFTNLAEIAPLHIIIGNHDLNLNNIANIDAITPIVDALANPNIHFHKKSGVFFVEQDFNFHVLSMVDPDNWCTDVDEKTINIALYHGSVAGVRTDMGWMMEHGELEYHVLENFDYALLGDIHKTNQALDHEGRCRYAGSLIQQNHGETNDKGFLFWDIQDKENFTVNHVPLTNPKPFISVVLNDDGTIPEEAKIPKGCRLRLISNFNHPADIIKKAAEIAKAKFKPESVSFLNKSINASVGNNTNLLMKENLRDIKVQENLIKDYLKDYNVSDEVLEQVYKLNRDYNSTVSANEDIMRNVNWKIKRLEWDNLFNYGEGNSIDFTGLSGVVGIFGKNYSGKSSIIDAALYTIFNTTSKNERKVTNVINQAKNEGGGSITIDIDGFEYNIERRAERHIRKSKGELIEEAKTSLELKCFDTHSGQVERLNELSKTDTDKYIRKMVGSIDDFMLTSFASQLDSMTFIREGSTKRKEILAKFLDLEIFEEKFKLAKDHAASLKGSLKRFDDKDYPSQIAKHELSLAQFNTEVALTEKLTAGYKKSKSELEVKINELDVELSSYGSETIDIVIAEEDYVSASKAYNKASVDMINLNNSVIDKEYEIKTILDGLNQYDIADLKSKKNEIESKQKIIEKLYQEIVLTGREVQGLSTRIKLLEEVPCGTQFTSCKFIKDAYDSKMRLPLIEDALDQDKEEHTKLLKEIEDFDVNSVNGQIVKYEAIVSKKARLENEVLKDKLSLNIAESNVTKYKTLRDEANELRRLHALNASSYESIIKIQVDREKLEKKVEDLNAEIVEGDSKLRKLYMNIGSMEANIENAKTQQQELDKLRNEYAAYDYFMRCMHTNGISYDIIKKKLPIINNEIAKTLANIVDFEVFFEDDGSKLNVLIKHPKFDPRPIEMGSGAEKTIASMAIRLALLQVSNLPKSNLFILDEPATALDADNMEGFIRMIDMVKSHYDVVILISHLDVLKDIVDTTITIEKNGSYSYVNI